MLCDDRDHEVRLSRILLPVDFSALSKVAAHHARTLASRFHCELVLVHVFEPRSWDTSGVEAAIPQELYDQHHAAARRMLYEFCAEELRDLPVRRMLLEGDVARAILDLARAEHVDLIVIPSHGYGRFRRLMFGSVAAKILHEAGCPVLTGVHFEDISDRDPISFRNIICVTDFDSAGAKVLRWGSEFAADFNAHLTIVHALPGADAGPGQDVGQTLPAMGQQVPGEGSGEFPGFAGASADVVLERGPVAEVVRRTSVSQRADLVVVGRHEHGGLPGRLNGNAHDVVRESVCPVLSV